MVTNFDLDIEMKKYLRWYFQQVDYLGNTRDVTAGYVFLGIFFFWFFLPLILAAQIKIPNPFKPIANWLNK